MRGAISWLLLVLFFAFAIVLAVSWYAGLEKEWVAALLTAAVSVLGLLYTAAENSRREIEARLFTEKAAAYKRIFELFPAMMKRMKAETKKELKDIEKDAEFIEQFIDIKTSLLIWGSDKILKAWLDIENATELGQVSPQKAFERWGNLYAAMREDLGHADLRIEPVELVTFFVKADERQKLKP